MAQYTPKTWTTGETITAAELNAIEAAAAAAAVKADADAAYDAKGAATAAQAAAVQRANHTGTQAASTITGLSTVATSGAYTDLSGKPAIPAAYTDAQAQAANASALAAKANIADIGTAGTATGDALKAAYAARAAAPTGVAATDTARLQAAIDTGPGIVLLQPGTYVAAGLTMKPGVHLVGSGVGATVIQLPAGSTADVIVTQNFATLTGSGNAAAGPGEWSIRDLVIDGNKAAAPAGGFGLRAYGYDFDLLNVQIKNCHGDGLYTEFANFGGAGLAEGSMEARLVNVKIHDCGGNGWHHRGPHDSDAVNVIAFNNGGHGIWTEQDPGGNYSAAGTSLVNCHVWGDHDIAAVLDTQTHFVNCQLEGALTGQLMVRAGDCSYLGGFIFYLADVGTNPGYGVQIGDTDKACTGLRMDTKLSGFSGATGATAALNFANTGGSNSIDALIYATGGTQVIGTTSPNDRLQIATVGLGTPAANAGQSQQRILGQQTFEVGTNNTAWTIQNAQQDQLNFNTNNKRMELVGGYVYRLYSDLWYSTPTVDLNGALGTVRTYGAATASRPSASAAGAGAMFYDTTLGRPIWSDGGQWRDAAGATV